MKQKLKAALLKIKAFLKKWLAPQIPFLFCALLFLWIFAFVLGISFYSDLPDPSLGFPELCSVISTADERTQAFYLCIFYFVGVKFLLNTAQIWHMFRLLGEESSKQYLLLESKLRARCAKK